MFTALKKIEDAAGKTIAKFTDLGDGEYIIAFTDSTYLRVGDDTDYDYRHECTGEPLEEYRHLSDEGLKAGIATQAEVDEYRRRQAAEQSRRDLEKLRREEANELLAYQRLKQKYEGAENTSDQS